MFHSAALRLTLWYLAIIMLIGLFFSAALYQVSTHEIDRGLRRQAVFLHNGLSPLPPEADDFDQLLVTQIENSKGRLQLNLVYFNLIILVFGGGLSYILARRTLKPIEDALDAQNRFTADASHELKTPLTALKTEIEVALRDKKMTSDQAKILLKSNLEEVDKLRILSEQLLILNRSHDETNGLDFKETSLIQIIQDAIKKVDPMAKNKNINIQTFGNDIQAEIDQANLTNLITILLDNAVKYSHQNNQIKITLSKKDHQAKISVQDFGIGIEPKSLPHIFERFYRADSARAKEGAGGYGLGLSIAQLIAKKHHGIITVKSIPNKETTFTLILPIRRA